MAMCGVARARSLTKHETQCTHHRCSGMTQLLSGTIYDSYTVRPMKHAMPKGCSSRSGGWVGRFEGGLRRVSERRHEQQQHGRMKSACVTNRMMKEPTPELPPPGYRHEFGVGFRPRGFTPSLTRPHVHAASLEVFM